MRNSCDSHVKLAWLKVIRFTLRLVRFLSEKHREFIGVTAIPIDSMKRKEFNLLHKLCIIA